MNHTQAIGAALYVARYGNSTSAHDFIQNTTPVQPLPPPTVTVADHLAQLQLTQEPLPLPGTGPSITLLEPTATATAEHAFALPTDQVRKRTKKINKQNRLHTRKQPHRSKKAPVKDAPRPCCFSPTSYQHHSSLLPPLGNLRRNNRTPPRTATKR
jgi:hypothetical protein